jgi:hypothetical protein
MKSKHKKKSKLKTHKLMKGTIVQLHKRKKTTTQNFGKGWCKHSKAKTCESTK